MKTLVTFCCTALLAASTADAGLPVVPPHARLVSPDQLARAVDARLVDRVAQALAAGRAGDAIAVLAAEPDPQAFELAASAMIDRLRASPPSAAGRAWLQWLAAEPVRLYQRHEETAGDWFVPALQVPMRAQGTLELWQHVERRDGWVQAFRTQPRAALRRLDSADASDIDAAADAVSQLSTADFAAVRVEFDRIDPAPALWLAAAQRAADPQAVRRLLDRGQPAQRLAALTLAVDTLGPAEAQTVLDLAAEQPALASAATLALARIAVEHPPALQRLQSRLADKALGSSAAAALARIPSPDRVERIESMLKSSTDARSAGNLVLALRLEDSADARAVLQRWAQDPRLPESLRRELQR